MSVFQIDSRLPEHPGFFELIPEAKIAYLRSLAYCSQRLIAGWLDDEAQAYALDGLTKRKAWRSIDQLTFFGFWLSEMDDTYSLPLEAEPAKDLGPWLTVITTTSEWGGRWQVARIPNPTYDRRRPIPSHIREFVMRRDRMMCGLCGDPVPRGDVHLDHIVPWSRGGSDDASNLQVAHSLCNMSKGNRV